MNPLALVLSFLPLFPLFIYVLNALFQYRLAKKWGHRNAWTAFIPVANYYQLCQLTKRPFWPLLVPVANLFALIQMQARLCRMNGERAVFQIYFFIPVLNLWAMHRLATNKRIYVLRDDRWQRLKTLVNAVKNNTPKEQILAKAQQAFMEPKEIHWLYYLARIIHRRNLKVTNETHATYIPEIILVLWLFGPILFQVFTLQRSGLLQMVPQMLPALTESLEQETIKGQPFLICSLHDNATSCNADDRCHWGNDCPADSGYCGFDQVPMPDRCLPKVIKAETVSEHTESASTKTARPSPRRRTIPNKPEKKITDTSNWKTFTDQDQNISFEYPSEYEIIKDIFGTVAVAMAPQTYRTQIFRPRINIYIQETFDFESFTSLQTSLAQEAVGARSIISEGVSQSTDYKAYEIIYVGEPLGKKIPIKWHEIWTVVDKKAYNFTYTAAEENFDYYHQDFLNMVQSLDVDGLEKSIVPVKNLKNKQTYFSNSFDNFLRNDVGLTAEQVAYEAQWAQTFEKDEYETLLKIRESFPPLGKTISAQRAQNYTENNPPSKILFNDIVTFNEPKNLHSGNYYYSVYLDHFDSVVISFYELQQDTYQHLHNHTFDFFDPQKNFPTDLKHRYKTKKYAFDDLPEMVQELMNESYKESLQKNRVTKNKFNDFLCIERKSFVDRLETKYFESIACLDTANSLQKGITHWFFPDLVIP